MKTYSPLVFILISTIFFRCSNQIELRPIERSEKSVIITFKKYIKEKHDIKLEEEYFDEQDLNEMKIETGVAFKVSNAHEKTKEDSIFLLSMLSLDFLQKTQNDSDFLIKKVQFFYEDSSYYLKVGTTDLELISNTISTSEKFINYIFTEDLEQAYSLIDKQNSQINKPFFIQEMGKFLKKSPNLSLTKLKGYDYIPSSSNNYDFDILRVDFNLLLDTIPYTANLLINPNNEVESKMLGFNFHKN